MSILGGPGAVVAERFEIEELAASGGMGQVYRARDRVTGRQVALKVLLSADEHPRFDREARLLATLDHPGIVRYVAHGMMGGVPYIAMEWIAGETLTHLLRRTELTIEQSLSVVRRVAEALSTAHARGIVHRDIKPANVLLEDGSIEKVRLIDFGVAHVGGEESLTKHSGFVGTPAYIAPEQARGDREQIGPAADVFSLGCVLYRCLVGRPPFQGENLVAVLAKVLLEDPPRLREIRRDAPLALDDLVAQMLAKEAEDRPRDAAVVCARLASLDMGLRTVPPAPSSRSALGEREARVVSIVMIGPPPVEAVARIREVLEEALGGAAARIERVRDGSFVVLVRGRGTAADEARGAADASLALRAVLPDGQIAVATGRAELAGDRLPVGEVIDRAGLLVRAAGSGEIRLDALTASLLDDRFVRKAVEKGALLMGRSDATHSRQLLGKPTPFVGRETELATLEGTIGRAFEDRMAKTLLVVGAAGTGKSRLRHELTSRIAASGTDVWIARADPMGATALGLAGHMLRTVVGVREGEPDDVRRRKLRERVARHAPAADVERLTLFLAESIGAPFGDEASTLLRAARREPVLLGDQIRRAWIDLFDAETLAHPLLVVLEDLHWADRPTVALIEAALSTFAERPLAVLGVARPEIEQAFPLLWHERDVQVLRLGPLSRRASEQLVRAALGARAEAVAAKLAEACNGNAFYLEELIRATAEGRGDVLPESIVAMVQSRLDTLEADDRRVLRAASVFGRAFWPDGVAHLLGGEHASDVQRRLERLVRAEVVVQRRESAFQAHAEMSFRHALLREGAYAMLTDADRTLGHRLAGEWLESAGSDDAAAVAEHFERGEQRTSAARWYAHAAARALEGNDLFGALELTDRGGTLEGDHETQGLLAAARATALRWLGRFPEAADHGRRAAALLTPGSGPWAEAEMARGTALLATGRADELAEMFDEVRPMLSADTAPEVLDVAAHLGRCLLQAGNGDKADELLGAVEQRLPATAELGVRARIGFARALQSMYAGETSVTLRQIEESAAQLDKAGDLRTACLAHINVAFNHISVGGFAQAERLLRETLDVARRLGLTSQAITTSENLGFAIARQGRLEEGAEIERQTAALCRRTGDRRMEGGARTYLATILVEMGKPEEAEAEARRAVEALEAIPPLRAAALTALALALHALGRMEEALDAASAAANIADATRVSEDEGPIRLVYAMALDATDRHDDACVAIRLACDRLLDRASRFDQEELRRQFLEAVPEHARTLALARAWGVL